MRRTFAIAAALGLACAASACAAPMSFMKLAEGGYTARIHMTTMDSKTGKPIGGMKGQMWGMGKKSRMEMESSDAGSEKMSKQAREMMAEMGKMIILTDMDKKVAYMLMSGRKTYTEIDLSDPSNKNSRQDWWGNEEFKLTELGSDKIDGHPCRKALCEWDKTKDREAGSAVMWLAKDLRGFPVQVQSASGAEHQYTMNYQDVKLGPVDASLFKIPEGYTKTEGLGGPGGMTGGKRGKRGMPGMDGDPKQMDPKKMIEEMKKKYGK